jgi:hypothetical protein
MAICAGLHSCDMSAPGVLQIYGPTTSPIRWIVNHDSVEISARRHVTAAAIATAAARERADIVEQRPKSEHASRTASGRFRKSAYV